MSSIYKLIIVKLQLPCQRNYWEQKRKLLEFPPMYSRGRFKTQLNVYNEAFFANYFQKNAPF